MKAHLVSLHKGLAAHHGRLAKIHADHGDALEDEDVHKGHHLAMAAEHERMQKFHGDAADAIDALPEVETFGVHGPKALVAADPRERWSKAVVPDNVAGAIPDNKDALEKRGLRTVPRFGAPTLDETIEESAADLPPELRKAIV